MTCKEKLVDAFVRLIDAFTALVNVASILSIGILTGTLILTLTDRLDPDKFFEIAILVFGFYFSAKAYTKAYEESISKMIASKRTAAAVTESSEDDYSQLKSQIGFSLDEDEQEDIEEDL